MKLTRPIHTSEYRPKVRAARSSIQELQPLAWEIEAIPEALSKVYVLRLPEHWRRGVRDLPEQEHLPPIISLYMALNAVAPEILCFFPHAFASDPSYRPPYWLASETLLPTERFLLAIQAWLLGIYGSQRGGAVLRSFQASDLTWEELDLRSAPPGAVENVLPGLVVRWLAKQQYELQLSNQDKHVFHWPIRVSPAHGTDAEMVTWPPQEVTDHSSAYLYSYYLRLRLASPPGSAEWSLLCQPGIRRWVSRPLTHTNGNGRTYVNLAWGRRKAVYVACPNVRWLSQVPDEFSLLRLDLLYRSNVNWAGNLPIALESLVDLNLPDPLNLLSHPEEFAPRLLILHDSLTQPRHAVGLGIEAADRWEVFNQLSDALPDEFHRMSFWSRLKSPQRLERSYAAESTRHAIAPAVRRAALAKLPPTRLELHCSDPDRWEQWIRAELGLTRTSRSETLQIVRRQLPPDIVELLPPDATESGEAHVAAERLRARRIQQSLAREDKVQTGVLLEMANFQELYAHNQREARRDPKQAVRWGLARTGRVTQFIRPESQSADDYELRVRHGLWDLLRQLDFHFNPPYTGFRRTSLPTALDLVGLRQIRLNALRRGERAVTLPLVAYMPADQVVLRVCLPGEGGPHWQPYHTALLEAVDFGGGYQHPGQVRDFFVRALENLPWANPTLLLLDGQNLRCALPELKDKELNLDAFGLEGIPPQGKDLVRVARLRYSADGGVPLVCPTHSFGRYSGIYNHARFPQVFYSIQERPLSAKRANGLRQIDAWRRHSWNPSTVEVVMAQLQPNDVPAEWAWVVHRLRQEATQSEAATLLPEPLHSMAKFDEYVMRVTDDDDGQ